jgi:predicted RNase H-like nuclease
MITKITNIDKNDVWLAGVDGCPTGWLIALVRPQEEAVRLAVVATFAEVLAAPEAPVLIAVDMPIGLPERTGAGGRAAESLVRPLLGQRQSSVFSVPSRAAIYAADYRDACRVALATSDPPRKVSKQLYMIAPKIREVDALVRGAPERAASIFESHPELAFWRLNGERALDLPKKVKGRPYPDGLALRRALLRQAGIAASILETTPRGCGADDVLDALACAITARRLYAGIARPFPDPPPRDAFGLPMAIWT